MCGGGGSAPPPPSLWFYYSKDALPPSFFRPEGVFCPNCFHLFPNCSPTVV